MRMKRADWDAVLNTNLTSAYLCIQSVIPSMLKQRWGRIINITSVFGQMGQAGQANYAASKAGLIGLTMAIAREVASRNITCNAIAPGFIETSMTAALSEEFKKTRSSRFRSAESEVRRHRQRSLIPRLRRSVLHHRPRAQRERRHADGLEWRGPALSEAEAALARAGAVHCVAIPTGLAKVSFSPAFRPALRRIGLLGVIGSLCFCAGQPNTPKYWSNIAALRAAPESLIWTGPSIAKRSILNGPPAYSTVPSLRMTQLTQSMPSNLNTMLASTATPSSVHRAILGTTGYAASRSAKAGFKSWARPMIPKKSTCGGPRKTCSARLMRMIRLRA